MNLYLRLIIYFCKLWCTSKRTNISVLGCSTVRMHVWPNDLDFNMHMNNGRYLTVMDIGRFDFMIRTGMFKIAMKKGYGPVLGSAKVRYRLPLMPFQAYDLQTQLVYWDEKWAYFEQRFIIANGDKAGAVAAIALLKGSLFDSKTKKTVPTKDILTLMDQSEVNPAPMPEHFKHWVKAEEALKSVTART